MDKMSEREAKGRQYLSEADKKMNSFKGLLGSVVGKSSAVDEAIELYIKAGNIFKMEKKWQDASKAFYCAARLQSRSGEKHESALNYINASNCFRKFDANQAIDCLLKAIGFYEELNRLNVCAKHQTTIADIYQTQLHDMDKAVQYYEMAADSYRADRSTASANKCLLNVANYSALKQKYEKAIEIYEEIAKYCIESSILKWSATNHFMRAALCHVCIDPLNGELALNRYEDMFPAFGDSRECRLIKHLISNIENGDSDGFSEVVRVYDSISRFDNWFVSILLVIKNKYCPENSEPDMK